MTVPDVLLSKDVKESNFDVELQFEVPIDFWDKEPKPPFEHPAQLELFKIRPPARKQWLEGFHFALMRLGWPRQTLDAVYSYFESPVDDPEEGEKRDPDRLPLVRFYVWIPGDWLLEHPDFFRSFDSLSTDGLIVFGEGPYRLVYWRIHSGDGPLKGTDWGDSGYFIVRDRKLPSAARAEGPKEWFPGLSGAGYDERLPSMKPFEWVEHYRRIGDLAVLAYGAYNAFGLIGPEKGGVAVVLEEPQKSVLATKDLPYDPLSRAQEWKRIVGMLSSPKEWSPRGRVVPRYQIPDLMAELRRLGYEIR